MMRKWNLPLTYAPKIPGVLDGTIWQTIRVGRKFGVGDLVSFHGWEGKPYRSRWSFRTPYAPLISVEDITIYPLTGIVVHQPQGGEAIYQWGSWAAASIALHDGIDPPTGEALRDVLLGLSPIPDTGVEAQIIQWRPKHNDSPPDGPCMYFMGRWGCNLKRTIRKDGTRGGCGHNPHHDECPNYKPIPKGWL